MPFRQKFAMLRKASMIVARTRMDVEVAFTSLSCRVLPMPCAAPPPKLTSPLRVPRKFLRPLLPPILHLRLACHPLLLPLPRLLEDQLLPHRAAHQLVQVLPHQESRQAALVILQLLLQLPLLLHLLPEASILVAPHLMVQPRALHQVQVLLDLLPFLPVDRLVHRHQADRVDLPVPRHPEVQAALQALRHPETQAALLVLPHPEAPLALLLDLRVLRPLKVLAALRPALLLVLHLPAQVAPQLLRLAAPPVLLLRARLHRHQLHTQPCQWSRPIAT
jgi:hypothetical protein